MPLVISKKYKYIFFHLPKNAGVSVSRALINEEKLLQIKLKISDRFYNNLKPIGTSRPDMVLQNDFKVENQQKIDHCSRLIM